MSLSAKRSRAFTLVELLVVIGIIAALIGILLPVLSGVQARGRDIKCQSNLRSILQAVHGYAAENKGSLPYGFYFNRSVNNAHPNPDDGANTWDEAGDNPGSSGDPTNDSPFISWASQVGKYMTKGTAGDNDNTNFPAVLQCPEAAQAYNHIVGYCVNFVAFPTPYYERQFNSGGKLWRQPPKTNGVFGHNILVYDTAVSAGLDNSVGYLVGGDVDDERFWRGALYPQYRFFDPGDRYGRIPPGINGNNKPVAMGANWKNIDPQDRGGNQGPGYPYQGNLRFRHVKDTALNAGFMDGHVESIKGKFKNDKSMLTHEVLRKHFMIKWPSGFARNPSVP